MKTTDSHLDRFTEAVERFSSRPAVEEGAKSVSYGELASLVRRIAFALVDTGGLPRVLIHLPQTAAAYASMLAAGLAGGFYTTTNTSAPAERRRGTFEDF